MTAPIFRRLDQLTGDVAESPVGTILDTADRVCAELAEVYELRTRVQELEASEQLARADADDAAETIGPLLAERDDLADRLRSSVDAHKITLGFLADAKREKRAAIAERDRARAERDTANLRAGARL